MKLLFVGTSSGRTLPNRFHSSILISNNDKNILVDAGDSISRALLSHGITFNSINDIIISHHHSDHLAGLPSLITQMIIEGRKEPLNIYTHQNLVSSLNTFLNISYIFLEKLIFEINITGFGFNQDINVCEKVRFLARQNSHVNNKHNIDIDEIHFISSSFLFLISDKKLFFTSDMGSINDLHIFDDLSPEIMITETTHIPFEDIEEFGTKFSVRKIFLTHIDDEVELNDWYNNLPINQKEKIVITHDGMTLEV